MAGFIDNIKTLHRGIKLIIHIERKYAFFLVLSSVLSTLPTIFSLNMISYIISELNGAQNIRVIVSYVLITVLGRFVLSMLLNGVVHIKNYYKNIFHYNEQLFLSQKIF